MPTGIGAAASEATEAVAEMFASWDFTPAFEYAWELSGKAPPFTGDTTIDIMAGADPWALVEQIEEQMQNSLMTQPIMGIMEGPINPQFTYLGDDGGKGTVQGTHRVARRVSINFLVAVWADRQLGGSDLVRALGGLIEGCVLYNSNRLSTLRNLSTHFGRTMKEKAEFWRYECQLSGNAIISVDA